MSAERMTPSKVRERFSLIASNFRDNEAAHQAEDRLWRDVLRAIAEDRCDDPKTCAAEAIETEKIKFVRWFA